MPVAAGRRRVLDDQRPGSWAFRSANAESGICGLNVAKNGAQPCWIGVARVVVEDGIAKVGRRGAGPHAAEQLNASLACGAVVVIERRRQIGVIGVGDVELNLQAGEPEVVVSP